MSKYTPVIEEERLKQIKRMVSQGCEDCKVSKGDLCDKHLYKFSKTLAYASANIPIQDMSVIMKSGLVEKQVQEVEIISEDTSRLTKFFPLYGGLLVGYLDKIDSTVVANGYSFVFYGYNGSGKTQTASHILATAVDRGLSGYFIFFKDLINLYNKSEFKHDKESENLYKYVMNCDLLVVDEVGKESSITDNLLGSFEQIIKHRSGLSKPTILITNIDFPREEVGFRARYKNSVYNSLLKDYRMIRFSPDGDFRMKNRKEWNL